MFAITAASLTRENVGIAHYLAGPTSRGETLQRDSLRQALANAEADGRLESVLREITHKLESHRRRLETWTSQEFMREACSPQVEMPDYSERTEHPRALRKALDLGIQGVRDEIRLLETLLQESAA